MTAIDRAIEWLRADPWRRDIAIATATVALASLLLTINPDQFETGWPEVAAGLGAFVLVALRRTVPALLLVIALGWGAAHVAIWNRPTPIFFAALVLLVTMCIRLERRQAIALGVAMAVVLYLFGLIVNDVTAGDSRAIIGIVWAFLAIGVADATRSWRQYKESADAQVRAAVLTAQAETRQQVSEERLAIARELHDLLAHNLSVMNVQTGAALHLLRTDPDKAETSLTAARDAGRSVLDELRELLSVLREPDDADHVATRSLPTFAEVGTLVETVRSAGLDIAWTDSGAPRTLAPAVSLAAYRIVQEALTNAAKHGAGVAELTTSWTDTELRIRVENPMRAGVDGTGSGLGVVGMRERAAVHGGTLDTRIEQARHVLEATLPATTAPNVPERADR